MQKNGGKQEFLYKCACLIDEIAQTYTYDDFVEASTAARYQSLAGERGRRVPRSAAGARNGKALSANPARRDEALQRAALARTRTIAAAQQSPCGATSQLSCSMVRKR